MVNEIDLFNLEDPNSIIRKIINGEEEIILAEIAQRKVSIPIGYELKELHLKSGNGKEINSLINEEIKKFKEAGYPENIYTPIYEAILNAYQHGNKRDPNKKIIFAHKIGETSLDIIVEDEGGVIEGVFVPFILKHRERDVRRKFINFYEFANKEKPQSNNGTGTSFIHAYMDEVNYYLGENGLIVHMTENKH